MGLRSLSIRWAIRKNVKFGLTRIMIWSIKVCPAKATLVSLYGLGLGCAQFFSHLRELRSLATYLRVLEKTSWYYVPRYFLKVGTYRIWNLYLYEDEGTFERVVASEDIGTLHRNKVDGRGAIILGAHCWLNIYGFAFHRQGIAVEILAGSTDPYLRATGWYINALLPQKVRYFLHIARLLKADFSERDLVRRVRRGGTALMHLDFPVQNGRGVTTDLFGSAVRFSMFPFRVAIKYRIPLYFSFIGEQKHARYRVFVVPAGTFATPEEGVLAYRNFLEARLRENPEMWTCVSGFTSWGWWVRKSSQTSGARSATS